MTVTISCQAATVAIFWRAANGNDILSGGPGKDKLTGSNGNDRLGGSEDDALSSRDSAPCHAKKAADKVFCRACGNGFIPEKQQGKQALKPTTPKGTTPRIYKR